MAKARIVTNQKGEYYGIEIHCPYCHSHILPTDWTPAGMTRAEGPERPRWGFNGNMERPTLTPSILTTSGRPDKPRVCHSFVTDGRVQFLSDCTHQWANQTLDLEELVDA